MLIPIYVVVSLFYESTAHLSWAGVHCSTAADCDMKCMTRLGNMNIVLY